MPKNGKAVTAKKVNSASAKPKKVVKPTSQKKQKEKSSARGRGRVTAAPTALDVNAPKPYFSLETTGQGGCRIRGCDRIGAVVLPAGQAYAVGDLIINFPVNPYLVENSRLAREANLYQKYKYRHAYIHYTPMCPTTTSGSIIMGMIRDPKLTIPIEWGEAGLQTLYASPGTTSGTVWNNHRSEYRSDKATNWCFANQNILAASSEEYELSPAQFALLAESSFDLIDSSALAAGNLYIEYDIDFEEPCLNVSTEGVESQVDMGQGTNFPFDGLQSVNPDNNLAMTIDVVETEANEAGGIDVITPEMHGEATIFFEKDGANFTGFDWSKLVTGLLGDGQMTIADQAGAIVNGSSAESAIANFLFDTLPPLGDVVSDVTGWFADFVSGTDFPPEASSLVSTAASFITDLLFFAFTRECEWRAYSRGRCTHRITGAHFREMKKNGIQVLRTQRHGQRLRNLKLFRKLAQLGILIHYSGRQRYSKTTRGRLREIKEERKDDVVKVEQDEKKESVPKIITSSSSWFASSSTPNRSNSLPKLPVNK